MVMVMIMTTIIYHNDPSDDYDRVSRVDAFSGHNS